MMRYACCDSFQKSKLVIIRRATLAQILITYWLGEVVSRGKLVVKLETSNALLVDVRVTAWILNPIAAFLLNMIWSEGPLRNDPDARPVTMRGQYDMHGPSSIPLGSYFGHKK